MNSMPEKTFRKNIDIRKNYSEKFGFNMPEEFLLKIEKGLNEETVKRISKAKNEPAWMLEFR
ncbi:MAG TPA: Fe-S cluster assembly protein SufB, partial [Candidatus Colwellbacteria bacterium]|nr:Fe-S cluster assembly protein SufB [Candidatus Colwellbacteria bacterium]